MKFTAFENRSNTVGMVVCLADGESQVTQYTPMSDKGCFGMVSALRSPLQHTGADRLMDKELVMWGASRTGMRLLCSPHSLFY